MSKSINKIDGDSNNFSNVSALAGIEENRSKAINWGKLALIFGAVYFFIIKKRRR